MCGVYRAGVRRLRKMAGVDLVLLSDAFAILKWETECGAIAEACRGIPCVGGL